MKTYRIAIALALVTLLGTTPALAQSRGGGSRGGGSHSSSSSSSRGGGSSSSSRGGGGFSSRSSAPTSSSRSSSSSMRSSSSSSNRSGSTMFNSNSPSPSSARSSAIGTPRSERPSSTSTPRSERHSSIGTPASSSPRDRGTVRSSTPSAERNGSSVRGGDIRSRGEAPIQSARSNAPKSRTGAGVSGERTGEVHQPAGHNYARPGRPGQMPPSSRPMHPAPYFHHPHHHHMIHMHPIYWHPLPPRPIFWPGFWLYCNSYWYDYHVTNVEVVHRYVQDTYNVDMISYAISGNYMYAIVRDNGTTYLQVFDQNDKLLAEHEISSKYIKAEIDRENGGCWIFKKKDKDPMLFIYTEGELLIYEAD